MVAPRKLNEFPLPQSLKSTTFVSFCKNNVVQLVASANAHGPRWFKPQVNAFISQRVPGYWLRPNHVYRVRRQGLQWELNPHDAVDRDLFLYGEKEPEDYELIRRLVKPGDTILDIGANFGFYAVSLAKALGTQTQVYAFEPHPHTFGRLSRHIALNGLTNVQAYLVGLSDTVDLFEIRFEPQNTGGAYLAPPAALADTQRLVQVTTLDRFVQEHKLTRVDFVKVDIEGHEYRFLKGARDTLTRFLPPMMMEFSPHHLARSGQSMEAMLAELKAIGYREFFYRDGDRIRPFTTSAFKSDWLFWNVFCFHKKPEAFPTATVRSTFVPVGGPRVRDRLLRLKRIYWRWLVLKAFVADFRSHWVFPSYSQEGEDGILRRIFAGQPQGFFVDIGAHHPKRFSNTFYFYQLGWRGINVDPAPGSMRLFNKVRPRDVNVEAAVANGNETLTYHEFNEPTLNGFSREMSLRRNERGPYKIVRESRIKTVTLAEIFDRHLPPGQTIDFLNIDVEGYDLEVLQSNDWTRYQPTLILAEELGPINLQEVDKFPVAHLLRQQGYELYCKTVNTLIFRKIGRPLPYEQHARFE